MEDNQQQLISQPKGLGWIADTPDPRDFKFSLPKLEPIQTVYIGTKYKFPNVYDQGSIGSCTAQGLAFLVHFNLLNKNYSSKSITGPYLPSRLFIYYYERVLEGTVFEDAGAQIRDGIKVLVDYGAPSEDLWKYDVLKFTEEPPQKALDYGKNLQATRYERIDNSNKQLLVNALLLGRPVVFGMLVYDSFMSDKVSYTGIVPMPGQFESVQGGHCMVITGYDMKDDVFIVRNSWGRHWGIEGYCRIPAKFLTNRSVAWDFWTVSMQE